MSFIQNIRDKYARVAVILIAVALIGFILTDYISGRSSSLFSSDTTTLGKVNGQVINNKEFAKKLEATEEQYRQRGQQVDQSQLVTGMWEQEVNQIIMQKEFDKLGLSISDKELTDMLYGPEPDQLARQYLTDPNAGGYDPNKVRDLINSIKKGKDNSQKEGLNSLLDAMESSRMLDKYKSLVAGSIHYPKWYFEKQNATNSLMAKISYVQIPDSIVRDDAKELAISDNEISDYISKHKDQYKLDDEYRSIEYVKFSAAPSSQDTAATADQVAKQRDRFVTTNDTAALRAWLETESEYGFTDAYFSKTKIQVPAKDSIFKLAKNEVYGPYLDGGYYVMAKLLDVKDMPDSVKARHILIKTYDPQTKQAVRDDSVAKKTIDSIYALVKKGERFDSLAKKLSEDPSSAVLGGLLKTGQQGGPTSDYFPQGAMVPEFNDACFQGKKGDIKIVKTMFGYHLIEILDQKGMGPNYKVAYFAKSIQTSDETERKAESEALAFAGSARDQKSFDDTYEKTLKPKQIQKLFEYDIASHAYSVNGVGLSRRFVKDIFEADKGDVIQPEKVGTDYVVAAVIEVDKKGTISVEMAKRRPYNIDVLLKKEKKMAEMKKRIGPVTTLEAVATKWNRQVMSVDSVRMVPTKENNVSFEYWVLGAIFNPANKGKVVTEPIQSAYNGMYVLRVDDVTTTALDNADVLAQKNNMERQARMGILMMSQMGPYNQRQYDPTDVLKKAATIKDNLNKFY